jgi:hypothetical protein
VTSFGVTSERPIERPYLCVQSLGKREIGSVIRGMSFEFNGDLHGSSVVRSEIESHVERIDDCQGL